VTGDPAEAPSFIARYKRILIAAALVAIGLAVFVLVWFQPQKLVIETEVNEPPAATARSTSVLASGKFRSLEHSTTGTASIVGSADGKRALSFEDLDTSNGPDLRVYLSEIEASDDWRAYGERFVDLGALKGNRGNQNYAIPDDVDVEKYVSAVIWCRRFTVGFGVAPLRTSG
jgi:hypothetical protein